MIKKKKRKVLKTLKLFDREVKHFIITHNSLNYWRLRLQKMKRKNKRKSEERLHKMTKVAGALISVVQHWGYHKVGCSSLTYIIIISSFWNRTLKTFIAHSGRRPYMEDSCVTVKAALQSSLKYKTEKERKIADIHKKWAVSFPFAVFTFSVVRKKRNLFTKKNNTQPKGVSSAWWGKKVINSSVLKSKKRKIKISDIYMCDKKRGKWFWRCRRVKAAALESSRLAGRNFDTFS